MRTKTQDKRLVKLIAFLRKLKPNKFDFGSVVSKSKKNSHWCATIACACGWTPIVFPRLVKWVWDKEYDGDLRGFKIKGREKTGWINDVSQELFGVEGGLFCPSHQNMIDNRLNNLGNEATPKQVAEMLEKFRELNPV